MGKLLSKIFGNKEMRILMLGLDAAGKTSILCDAANTNLIFDKYIYYYISYSISTFIIFISIDFLLYVSITYTNLIWLL